MLSGSVLEADAATLLPADCFYYHFTIANWRRMMKREFLVERQGRSFVLYAGLLDLAHQQGLKSISTELVQVPSDANGGVAICTAVVTMEKDGEQRVFTGIGDACRNNVAPAMALCLIRMAETRSKARALRDAVNIGVAAFEELGEEDAYDGAPERGYQIGTGRSTRPAAVRTPAAARQSGGVSPRSAVSPAASALTIAPEGQNDAAGRITDSQINALRNLSRRAGVEVDEIAKEKFQADLAGLSQAQAGQLIKTLSAQTNGRTVPVNA
jgi:hypothetical protein